MNTLRPIALASYLLLACGDSGGDGPSAGTGATSGTGGVGVAGAEAGTGAGAGGAVTSGAGGAMSDTGCNVIGSPFGHQGTATIRGTGALPPGLEPGLQINLSLDSGNVAYGVLGENLFDIVSVCDSPTFLYEITKVDAGTYELYLEVLDPDADAAVVYEAAGDLPVTVTDGAIIEHDVRFDGS